MKESIMHRVMYFQIPNDLMHRYILYSHMGLVEHTCHNISANYLAIKSVDLQDNLDLLQRLEPTR